MLYVRTGLRTVPKLIEVIRPRLHHLDALAPELSGMLVGAAVFLPYGPAVARSHPNSMSR
jgi:hypothetical protein